MNNHYFDANGVYTHSAPANHDSLPPPNALRQEPPRKEGCWPVRDAAGSGWELAPDHRGKRGWLNGEAVTIVAPGPLPEGWADSLPLPVDTRDSGEKRRDDFVLEVDPVRDIALAYQLEAEAWRLAGDGARTKKATEKYRRELQRLLEKKEAVRSRHPDSPAEADADASQTETATTPDTDCYYLTRSGIYHATGCSYTRAAGEWLGLADILERKPGARACGKCLPATEG